MNTPAQGAKASDRERAVDAFEQELGPTDEKAEPVVPSPPVENPVEDEDTGIAPEAGPESRPSPSRQAEAAKARREENPSG